MIPICIYDEWFRWLMIKWLSSLNFVFKVVRLTMKVITQGAFFKRNELGRDRLPYRSGGLTEWV